MDITEFRGELGAVLSIVDVDSERLRSVCSVVLLWLWLVLNVRRCRMHVRTFNVSHAARTHEDDYDCRQGQQSRNSVEYLVE